MTTQSKTIVSIQSHLEMVGFIKANGTQCRFVSMVSETPVKNIRAACPFKSGLVKISRKRGMINVNFATSVAKRIAERLGVEPREVEYTAGDVWYKHVETVDGKALPLCVNKKTPENGEFYLQYFPIASENVYRLANGDFIAEAEVEKWMYADNRPDFKPCVISIKVSNIKELRASGVIMQAEDLAEAEAALSSAA